MSEYIFKLPDLGEGTVEAEIIEWHVKPGDIIKEGQIVVDVMTDKANIEVPAPASGRVLRTSGQPGDMVIVGTELIAIETDVNAPSTGARASSPTTPPPVQPAPRAEAVPDAQTPLTTEQTVSLATDVEVPATNRAPNTTLSSSSVRVLASPALRRHALELGIDLGAIQGSGPRGRILRKDLETGSTTVSSSMTRQSTEQPTSSESAGEITEVRIIGVRRVIAERMQAAKREIPHFAYVEETDVTALERLRAKLNERSGRDRLTLLPFIGLALFQALKQFPQCNALHDAEKGVLRRYASVHLGIATQTPDGLKVPVIKNADQLEIDGLASAISAAATKARDGTATRDDLTGSTITMTSLGKLGGIVSTPVINAPELAIIGVNKAVHRPMVIDGRVEIRLMMNLSSSFDHRFIDGFDAASMIQVIKSLLEEPALLFIPA
jgi:2-oxoisovalerate dehydrogenase E2 component (dihydrolipoyl transacylase)